MIMQPRLALRWRVKDLAQLLFSAQPNATPEEIQIFWRTYAGFAGLDPDLGRIPALIRRKAAVIIRHDNKRRRKMQ